MARERSWQAALQSAMRTTLIIDDDLLRQAKRLAAERNVTVSSLVNEALREALRRPLEALAPFSMPTYGRPDRPVQHEPEDFAAEDEREDRQRLGGSTRTRLPSPPR